MDPRAGFTCYYDATSVSGPQSPFGDDIDSLFALFAYNDPNYPGLTHAKLGFGAKHVRFSGVFHGRRFDSGWLGGY